MTISPSDGLALSESLTVQLMPIGMPISFIGTKETTYEIWLCDPRGIRLSLLDNLISFEIVKVVNSVSYCSITLPGNFHEIYQTLIGIDYIVEFWRSPSQGFKQLETIFFIRDVIFEEDNKGNDIVILSGPDAMDLLDRRIVAYAAGTSQASKTDFSDDMMKEIVKENLGSSATDSNRDISGLNFTIESDISAGPYITKSFSWRNLLTVLQEISYVSSENGISIYFDVIPYIASASELGFRFITKADQPGEDKTYSGRNPVLFSKEWGNLEEPKLSYDYTNEKNYIYGGGQGEGTDRTISEKSDDARIGTSIWNRREAFADARNETTVTGVSGKAKEVLRENTPLIRFTGKLLDTPQARYGVDWFFGDKVEISYRNIQIQGIAKALKIKLDKEGNEIVEVKVETALVRSVLSVLDDVILGENVSVSVS